MQNDTSNIFIKIDQYYKDRAPILSKTAPVPIYSADLVATAPQACKRLDVDVKKTTIISAASAHSKISADLSAEEKQDVDQDIAIYMITDRYIFAGVYLRRADSVENLINDCNHDIDNCDCNNAIIGSVICADCADKIDAIASARRLVYYSCVKRYIGAQALQRAASADIHFSEKQRSDLTDRLQRYCHERHITLDYIRAARQRALNINPRPCPRAIKLYNDLCADIAHYVL